MKIYYQIYQKDSFYDKFDFVVVVVVVVCGGGGGGGSVDVWYCVSLLTILVNRAGSCSTAYHQRTLLAMWLFQDVSRSSVRARCSGRQVLADDGDGAQRQRSGPAVYLDFLWNKLRMQLHTYTPKPTHTYIYKQKHKYINTQIQ